MTQYGLGEVFQHNRPKAASQPRPTATVDTGGPTSTRRVGRCRACAVSLRADSAAHRSETHRRPCWPPDQSSTNAGSSPPAALDCRRIFCKRLHSKRTSNSPNTWGGGAVEAGDREIFVPRSAIGESAADERELARTGSQRQSVPALVARAMNGRRGAPGANWPRPCGAPPIAVFQSTERTRRVSWRGNRSRQYAHKFVAPVCAQVSGRYREHERRR